MKKTLVVASLPLVFSAAANAQSSVTLYGLIDVGIVYTNNAASQKQWLMSSGNIQGSRWGLRGAEDLGGGLKAIFVLENGFSIASGRLGQGGDEFGRQAYVGLQSARAGTVTFGRQYDSIADFTGVFEVADQWSPFYGAHPGDLDNMNNTNRVNNTVKFKSLTYGGFSFGGMYSLGGVAGQFNRNQVWSLGAGYGNGPLTAGIAYVNVKDPNFSYFGNNSTSSATASNMTASRVYSGYASAKTQEIWTAGAAYAFGGATVGATYSNTQFKDIGTLAGLPATGAGGDAKFHNVEVNFKYQFTPALLAGAAYDYTKGYGVNDAKYHQGVIGLDYFLSKRTDVYADAIYQHATGTDSTGNKAVANINFLSASSTQNQVMGIVGMRHKF
ncbi:porin [Caballeronia sp. GACF4]|uniref:porin n=1 Tax=Caballeronia sp. GACF4 TaxID=2921763 RepID=UPI0020283B9A|nr:porin [Caballeronia sp. GACF4]